VQEQLVRFGSGPGMDAVWRAQLGGSMEHVLCHAGAPVEGELLGCLAD